jgi:hypothetical protein
MTDPIELAGQQPPIPAGWYPDAERPGAMRYWDGVMWTEQRTEAIYGTPAKQTSGMAVGALICGIIGAAFLLAPVIAYPIPLALGLAAIVLGFIGRGGMGYWGVGLGAVALIAGIAGFMSVNNIGDNANDQLQQSVRQLNRQLHPGVPGCHDPAAIARYHRTHPFARNIQCVP